MRRRLPSLAPLGVCLSLSLLRVPHVTTRSDILTIRPCHRVRLAPPRPLKASVFSSPFERQINQPYPDVTNALDVTGMISVDAAEPSSGTRNGTSLANGTVMDTLRSSLGIMPDRNFARNGRGQTDVLATAIPRNTDAPDVLARNMEQIDVRKGNRIPLDSTLRAEAWKAALDELNLTPKYPTLPHSIYNGFNVGIPIIQHTYSPANNLQSPESQRAFIEVMTNELRMGRWLGPYSAQEIESVLGPFQTSPISMIPKSGKPGKFRLLQNLSYPRQPSFIQSISATISSINSNIDSTLYPCLWGTFANTCRLIWTLPPGSQGAVRDISEAYRLIPLHTSQKAGAVIRVSNQEFCIDTRLMFGLSASGGTFGHLADAGMEIARGKGLGPVTKWVDDHLWLRILRAHLDEYNKLRKELQERVRQSGGVIHNKGRLLYRGHTLPSGQQEEFDDDFMFPLIDMSGASSRSIEDSKFTYAFCDIDQVTLPLGYTWALEKDIPFCESPTYFGFQWHLETRTVSIPAEKRAKYSEHINRWEKQPTHDLDEATSLHGKLLHVSLVLRRGKAYLTELEKFIANFSHVASHVRHHVPRHWPADLAWWKDILAAPISSRIPGPTNLIDVHAYSDASSGYGIGLYIRGYWRAYRLLPGWRGNHNERDIGWAEAVGFYLLVQTIRGQATRGHQYKIWGDNEGVVEGWWNGRSRNRDTNNIFRYIHEITTTNDFGVHTCYVPSAHNPADPFSRGQHGPHNLLLPRIPIPSHLSEFIVDYDTPYSTTELNPQLGGGPIVSGSLKRKAESWPLSRIPANTQHVTTANTLRYPQNLNPLPSPLRPHCPARDRLIAWKPAAKRSLKDAAGHPLVLPEEYLERIQMLLETGYAESTRETYASGLLAFHVFCDTQNIPEDQRAPCGKDLLNAWMATMAGSYAGTSIKNYVHGVRAWHIVHGIEWELDQATFDTMIHGAERLRPAQSRLKKRQPYTVDYITQILTDLDRTNPFDIACGACLTTAFYCVARLGELTVPTLKDFSPNKHVTTQSIREDTDRSGFRTTVIHVPCTKASQTQGEDIYFSKQLGTTDPDEWLKHQLTTNKPATTEHLYAYSQRGSTRRPLTNTLSSNAYTKLQKTKVYQHYRVMGFELAPPSNTFSVEYLLT
ncbi:hypothetical protein D9757_015300 [Collybiopsis confluens]|uniref:Uncharacterized protein n=1 Tax=Collybiopsis confluens TaxID=2823264 RepID=A0A8H5FMW0_9AGAR|nr:hypothetical protein D9757_015300 [Collybiopsis confluens]